MTDSFTAEMGWVCAVIAYARLNNKADSRPQFFLGGILGCAWPKAPTHRTGYSPGNADGASAPSLECGIPVQGFFPLPAQGLEAGAARSLCEGSCLI